MGALDRIRRRLAAGRQPAAGGVPAPAPQATPEEEARLWAVLREDPNDVPSFHALAEIVRRRAEEGHEGEGGDPRRAADDAVWSLAEELAHSGKAWYPLVELGRLSVHDDREQALKRFATAADRDASGRALATCVQVLREEGLPAEAIGLGVGHWRPREQEVEVGRQLVLAAVEARRPGDARRTLEALGTSPDADAVARVRAELTPAVDEAERLRAMGPGSGPIPVVDLREKKSSRRS